MSDESNGDKHGVSRRDLLSGAAAALAAAAVTGTPARLLASTDDWRVDLTPPRLAGNGSMMGVPCVSSAQTYQHSLPRIFWKRTQMSVWMYSTRWPRWMAPLA